MSGSIDVSVVVPVYNTAPYLRKCLDSLVGQTLGSIEIICVDDGSTDESPEILQEYAENDSRIRLFSQPNQYAGVARNNGMSHARGKYIMFCDSDDWMALDALELMCRQCEQDDADICVCAGERYYERLGLTVPAPGYLETGRLPERIPFNRASNADHLFSFTTIMMFNKMFRLDFLRDHSLEYGRTRNGEDVGICALALWYAEKITVVKKPLVFYRIDRPDSLVGTLEQSAVDPLQAWEDVWRVVGVDLGDTKRSFDCKVLGVVRHGFRNIGTGEAFEACYSFLRNGFLDELDLRPRPDGYYYTPWYNEFIEHLRNDSKEAFAAYLIYSTGRDLETEDARKYVFRCQLRDAQAKIKNLDKELRIVRKEKAEIERKFGKVEMIYRCGVAVLRGPRALKKMIAGGKGGK